MSLKIEYVSGERDVERFIRFAWDVYRDNQFWVPPNVSETKAFLAGKGRFFDHCKHQLFMVTDEGKIIATIAAFYDKNLVDHWGKRIGQLGYFEALPGRLEEVRALFAQAELFLKSQGAQIIRAPVNGSISNPAGLLVNAFNQMPVFLMPYNPSYYRQYFSRLGYKPAKELIAYTMDLLDHRLERKINFVLRHAEKSQVKIRTFDRHRFREESNLFAHTYSETFKEHWGYAPQSEEEVYEMISPFKVALVPDFILFAEHEGKCVGFTLCVPDYNPIFKKLNGNFEFLNAFSFLYLARKIHEARLIAIGVVPEWRGKGVAPLLVAAAYDAMIEKGYTKCEYSWVFRENESSRNVAAKFHSNDYREYLVFEKSLSGGATESDISN